MEVSLGTGDAQARRRRPEMDAHETLSYALLDLLDDAELRCVMEDMAPERLACRDRDELFPG